MQKCQNIVSPLYSNDNDDAQQSWFYNDFREAFFFCFFMDRLID